MSAALVRKALELSTETEKLATQPSSLIKKGKKSKDKKKKKTAASIQKQNLKILKALEYKGKTLSSKSKNQKETSTNKIKSAFTDEDFTRFEAEHFVTQ